MTDKKYYCQNGDLIEVGKEYKDIHDNDPIKVVGFDGETIIIEYSDGLAAYEERDFESLWQALEDQKDKEIAELKAKLAEYESVGSEPDEDGWIEHTTGKQPVADDMLVDIKAKNGEISSNERAAHWVIWDKDWITHYRIVEDKQESDKTLENFAKHHNLWVDLGFHNKAMIKLFSEYLQKKGI